MCSDWSDRPPTRPGSSWPFLTTRCPNSLGLWRRWERHPGAAEPLWLGQPGVAAPAPDLGEIESPESLVDRWNGRHPRSRPFLPPVRGCCHRPAFSFPGGHIEAEASCLQRVD